MAFLTPQTDGKRLFILLNRDTTQRYLSIGLTGFAVHDSITRLLLVKF
jgi:hypothetical protein